MTPPDETAFADLTGLVPTAEHVLEIIAPNGKPTGWRWTLAPASHPKAVAFAEDEARRALERERTIREAQFNSRRYEGEDRTPDQARRDNYRWVVARVLGWTPVKIDGAVRHFSDKATEDLLIRPELAFAAVQVTRALSEESRFLPSSAAP